MNKKNKAKVEQNNHPKEIRELLFTKENYYLVIASLVLVIIGFMLMSGSEGDIYDFRRITLAPIVVIIGFILGIYAIFYRKK
jgi:hypothetical protein